MFKRFREKIERALERKEAERSLSRDDMDRLLHQMREELIEQRSRIPKLEKELERLESRARQQIQRAELAHGKAQEAERGGDSEAAQSALDAARRALQEAEDLRRQAAETLEEVEKQKLDYSDKMDQLKEAERNRSALVARSRRVGTARKLDEMMRGPESGLKRFEKAEEDIDAAEDLAAAEREVAEALGEDTARDLETDYELRRLDAAKEAEEIEKKLSELKRQIDGE
jgi:hypothetical protein